MNYELYDCKDIDLSSDLRLRKVQNKILNNEYLTVSEKMIAGHDHPVKELYGCVFKSNCAYRSITREMYDIYEKAGFIIGTNENDDYMPGENNKGVDWYLGGVDPKYGYGEVILECPAYKEYFTLTLDNGNGMSYDPSIKHLKSSGSNPVPMSIIKYIEKPEVELEEKVSVKL